MRGGLDTSRSRDTLYHIVTQQRDTSKEDEAAAGEPESARKERVLHTRIPVVLERELKRLADSTRMPVSNLVRAILEDALAVADRASGRVEEQLRHAAERMSKERESIRDRVRKLDPLEGVVAFQPVALAQATECAQCRRPLAAGEDARLGIRSEPGPLLFVCPSCVPTRDASASPSKEGESP